MTGRDVAKYVAVVSGGWAVAGAVGAASSSGPHPILKGALYSAVIGGVAALVTTAILSDPNAPKQVGTSGPLRFP